MINLEKCPFCETTNEFDLRVLEDGQWFFVKCGSCCARGPISTKKKQAIDAWNLSKTIFRINHIRKIGASNLVPVDLLKDIHSRGHR